MSIDAKKFDKHKNPLKYVVEFLKKNPDKAFTAEYISKQIGISAQELREALYWDLLARALQPNYRSLVERASVGGVDYYKYKSA